MTEAVENYLTRLGLDPNIRVGREGQEKLLGDIIDNYNPYKEIDTNGGFQDTATTPPPFDQEVIVVKEIDGRKRLTFGIRVREDKEGHKFVDSSKRVSYTDQDLFQSEVYMLIQSPE